MKKIISYMREEMVIAAILGVVGVVVMCMLEESVSCNTAVTHNIEIWIEACGFVDFFFPLFVSMPFAWKIYFMCKDGYINYVSIRTKRRCYLGVRMTAGMCAVFVMVFVVYYGGLLYAELFAKPEVMADDVILNRYIWGELQMEKPLLFGVFWCAWKSILGALICLFGYFIALLSENLFVISLLPFVYCVLENFVTGTLGIENYSIYTSFVINRLTPDSMKIHNYFAGAGIFVCAACVITVMMRYGKRQVDSGEEHSK